MKKNYKMPETQVMQIELQQVIAGSPFTKNGVGELTGGKLQDVDAKDGVVLSRVNVWGEEEE